jgi:hypothetical protein
MPKIYRSPVTQPQPRITNEHLNQAYSTHPHLQRDVTKPDTLYMIIASTHVSTPKRNRLPSYLKKRASKTEPSVFATLVLLSPLFLLASERRDLYEAQGLALYSRGSTHIALYVFPARSEKAESGKSYIPRHHPCASWNEGHALMRPTKLHLVNYASA